MLSLTFARWQVVDAVHANGSYIFLQLWALGRASDLDLLKAEDPSFDLVGPSDIPISPSHPTPRPLTVDEIKTYVQWYANAANKAVNRVGFDGVELHFAGGYLPDQFLQLHYVHNPRWLDYKRRIFAFDEAYKSTNSVVGHGGLLWFSWRCKSATCGAVYVGV